MTNKILRVSEPFILGKCLCGCGIDIHIRREDGKLCRFKLGHHNRGERHRDFRGGRFAGIYIQIWAPNHPYATKDGYVPEHRLVMEKHLGRYLDPKEQIHHKNHNKKDNRLDNLQLFPNVQDHNKIHIKEKHENDTNKRRCVICGGIAGIRKDNRYLLWLRNPLNKNEWVCRKDWRKIMRKLTGRKH